jgi:hypothetical protein
LDSSRSGMKARKSGLTESKSGLKLSRSGLKVRRSGLTESRRGLTARVSEVSRKNKRGGGVIIPDDNITLLHQTITLLPYYNIITLAPLAFRLR